MTMISAVPASTECRRNRQATWLSNGPEVSGIPNSRSQWSTRPGFVTRVTASVYPESTSVFEPVAHGSRPRERACSTMCAIWRDAIGSVVHEPTCPSTMTATPRATAAASFGRRPTAHAAASATAGTSHTTKRGYRSSGWSTTHITRSAAVTVPTAGASDRRQPVAASANAASAPKTTTATTSWPSTSRAASRGNDGRNTPLRAREVVIRAWIMPTYGSTPTTRTAATRLRHAVSNRRSQSSATTWAPRTITAYACVPIATPIATTYPTRRAVLIDSGRSRASAKIRVATVQPSTMKL